MVDHIVVPLDGSSLAERVLPHTVAVARAMDAKVTLLRAVARKPPESGSRAVDPLSWHMRKSEAEAYMKEMAQRLRETGLAAQVRLAEGRAANSIIEFAREEDVDLIIISSHGDSGLSAWNISSVVQKVILRAYTPTMIVRAYQPVTEELDDLRYRRLLVPLDGSQRAECTLPWAREIAEHHDGCLILAHVVKEPEVPRRAPLSEEEADLVERLTALNREKGQAYLDDLAGRLDLDVEPRLVVSEDPAMALHTLADEEEVDLVVMAAHGYSGKKSWPYGSVALNFIAYGSEPLLIVQDVPAEEAGQTEAERAARERAGH
jgi:nucleotide-binding universal stress UspA family protein